MPFAIPMIWREGKDHIIYCYFYMINLKGINHKNKHYIWYLNVPSAIRPISHGPDHSFSEPDGNMEYSSDSQYSDMTVVAGDGAYKPKEDDQPWHNRTQWPDTRPEPFKGVYSVAGFTSQRETSVGIRNNVLLILRSW